MRKRRLLLTLGKDKGVFEQHYVDSVKNYRLRLIKLEQIKGQPGVMVKPNGVMLNSRLMNPDLMNHLRSIAGIYATERMVVRCTDERLSLARQLKELGRRPAIGILNEKGVLSEKRVAMAKKEGRLVKIKAEVSDEKGTKKIIHPNSVWARDSWTKLSSEKRISFFGKPEYEEFGEGGRVVELPGKIVIATETLRNNPQVERLKTKGFTFIFTKDGYQFIPRLSRILGQKTYLSLDHPDLFVGTTGRVLLTNRGFFNQNEKQLKEAASKANLEIVFVPESEAGLHPANFLPLDENTILMDRAAKETISLLRTKGVNVIPTRSPITANREGGGGVRCIVNEL